MRDFINDLILDLSNADSELVYFAILLVATIVVLDVVAMVARSRRLTGGFLPTSVPISLDGSDVLGTRRYVSPEINLAGVPDAIVRENGFLIPVERKPLSNKIRDRYIAQLLVYMRLVEACEKTRPPYGYLILGKNCRVVKIENTEERQRWLDGILTSMLAVFEGGAPSPDPVPAKCARCDVREHCRFRADQY